MREKIILVALVSCSVFAADFSCRLLDEIGQIKKSILGTLLGGHHQGRSFILFPNL